MTDTLSAGSKGDANEPGQPTPARHHRSLSHWLFGAFKLGLTVLAFVYLYFKVDFAAAWAAASHQNVLLLLVAAGAVVLQIGGGALRWHFIVRGLGGFVPLPMSFRYFYICSFFNVAGMVGGGDVVRGVLAYRAHLTGPVAIYSVLLDRMAAVAGVALVVIATAPLFVARVGNGAAAFAPSLIAAAMLIAVIALGVLSRLMPRGLGRFKAVRLLVSLSDATREVFLRPAHAIPVLGWAALTQVVVALAAYVLGQSLGITATLVDFIVLMQPIALLAALPISIGGWGVRETAMVAFLGLVGVPASSALLLSVQFGLLSIVVASPGALLMLMERSKRSAAAPAKA